MAGAEILLTANEWVLLVLLLSVFELWEGVRVLDPSSSLVFDAFEVVVPLPLAVLLVRSPVGLLELVSLAPSPV